MQGVLSGQVLSEREREAISKVANRYYSEATAESLLKEIAQLFQVSVAEIKGDKRTGKLVDARTVFAFKLRTQGVRLKEIGEYINRDHSTAYHLYRRAITVPDLKEMAEALS